MKRYIVLASLCVLMASVNAAAVNATTTYPGQQTFTLSSLPTYATCAAEAKVINIKATAAAYVKAKGLILLNYTCGTSPSWTVTGYQ